LNFTGDKSEPAIDDKCNNLHSFQNIEVFHVRDLEKIKCFVIDKFTKIHKKILKYKILQKKIKKM
jgi:hypothetical protein